MIIVFRYGHRVVRDKRVTTHCALISRAFGVDKVVYSGQRDNHFEDSINKASKSWGGDFTIEHTLGYLSYLTKKKEEGFKLIHLTMYGINLPDFKKEIKALRKEKIIIFIGAEKVPKEVYNLADYNVAVGNQPHSEIAALTLFLDRLLDGKELLTKYKGAKREITETWKNKKK